MVNGSPQRFIPGCLHACYETHRQGACVEGRGEAQPDCWQEAAMPGCQTRSQQFQQRCHWVVAGSCPRSQLKTALWWVQVQRLNVQLRPQHGWMVVGVGVVAEDSDSLADYYCYFAAAAADTAAAVGVVMQQGGTAQSLVGIGSTLEEAHARLRFPECRQRLKMWPMTVRVRTGCWAGCNLLEENDSRLTRRLEESCHPCLQVLPRPGIELAPAIAATHH